MSNFHTYAPDMMQLFAKGIEDNKGLITDAINGSFNLSPKISAATGGQEITVPRAGRAIEGRPLVLTIDGREFARLLLPYSEMESQRVGVRMATGGAY